MLIFILYEALITLEKIGTPSLVAIKLNKGLLWESVHLSKSMLTPFSFQVDLIGLVTSHMCFLLLY